MLACKDCVIEPHVSILRCHIFLCYNASGSLSSALMLSLTINPWIFHTFLFSVWVHALKFLMVTKLNVLFDDTKRQLQEQTELLEFYIPHSQQDWLPWVKVLCDEDKNGNVIKLLQKTGKRLKRSRRNELKLS